MRILGISALFHDSAAALVVDGDVRAAAQQERFSRVKNDASFPLAAIESCLAVDGSSIDDVDHVAYFEKPHLKLERILANARACYPRGQRTFVAAMRRWAGVKAWTPSLVRQALVGLSPTGGRDLRWDGRTYFARHHASHAASAFFPSPFEDAAVLTVDGVGEWATASLAVGSLDDRGVPRLGFLEEIRYPNSLGLLYSAFTRYLGFEVNEGEYKMMGLAPYGEPRFASLIRDRFIALHGDGSFALDLGLFTFQTDEEMFGAAFEEVLGQPMRQPEAEITEFHMDVAASVQAVTEQAVEGLVRRAHERTGRRHLCLAGGVALNCVANGRILRSGPFDDVWVQPAAGDAGGALGAALLCWHHQLGGRRPRRGHGRQDGMHGARLGPAFDDDRCADALREAGLAYEKLDPPALVDSVADLLCQGHVVGWFQGRMEFGPRALGGRSILADPRSSEMQRVVNLRVKFRESFRPLAPSVLRERVEEWFELAGREGSILGGPGEGYDSPYMLLVAPVATGRRRQVLPGTEPAGLARIHVPRSEVPACTHVDGSARVQTVAADDDPLYHALLSAFAERTGVPVLLNTSFNVRGEPIVCTPEDAVGCFLATEIDALALGGLLARKPAR